MGIVTNALILTHVNPPLYSIIHIQTTEDMNDSILGGDRAQQQLWVDFMDGVALLQVRESRVGHQRLIALYHGY